jgi:hypothetical protein
MWQRLWGWFSGNAADQRGSAGSDDRFHVYRVRHPEGEREIVSLLPEDRAFAAGLSEMSIVGVSKGRKPGDSWNAANLLPNPRFIEFLHEVIASEAPALPEVQEAAFRQEHGHVYVIDARTPTPDAAVPPEDILGTFRVENGAIVPGSYQRNPNHLLVSSRGFFALDPRLHETLVARIT